MNALAAYTDEAERGLVVEGCGLSRAFGSRRVLTNLDLTFPSGQFLAIVGRSGCGKSTLLRLLAGLDTADRGVLRYGREPAGVVPRSAIRMMYQEPRLLPWARVLANVEVGLGIEAGTRAAQARAAKTLSAVGLGDRADVWPSTLSGGQRQRVALARALVSSPRLLALDEPLGALDALTRIEMQALIERVWREQGFTAVLVTHDVAEALTLADRVVMIEDGAITLDLEITLPRPRRRGSVALATLEQHILSRLLKSDENQPDYVI